ncbi:MAG TPA: hypothetical protein VFS12_06580, partial [Terriglobia bacterium]|nr:hypothetical protein [Terriglobia bacterium]
METIRQVVPVRHGNTESKMPSGENLGKEDQRVKMTTKPTMNPAPITLEGQYARLEPLDAKHAEGLFAIGQDEKIWRYLLRPKLESVPDALGFVEEALRVAATGSQIPFAIIDQ